MYINLDITFEWCVAGCWLTSNEQFLSNIMARRDNNISSRYTRTHRFPMAMYSFVIIVIQFHSMFLIVNFISEHMVSFLILWEFLIPEKTMCLFFYYNYLSHDNLLLIFRFREIKFWFLFKAISFSTIFKFKTPSALWNMWGHLSSTFIMTNN
jgi:hypothetical protein